jgi:putative ABC transport system substrate-binding protein
MRRREFIAGLGGAAMAGTAFAQSADRPRRLGVLTLTGQNDPEARAWLAALVRGLQDLGWSDGRNLQIDYRWLDGQQTRAGAVAAELVRAQPDVILSSSGPSLEALRRETRSIPIVFLLVIDPVGAGIVTSLAAPGGNITGFTNFERSMGGKWLEVLKEIAPQVNRVVILGNPDTAPGRLMFDAVEAAAPSFRMTPVPAAVREVGDIATALDVAAQAPNSGFVLIPSPITISNRAMLAKLAAERRLPGMYPFRFFVRDGGLLSYGIDLTAQFRQAASYVDRILRGTNPGTLPIQAATKFELAVNLKAAKALGLEVPPTLLARADEVIE